MEDFTRSVGMRPDPAARERDYHVDLVLVARGGNARLLRIDRQGNLLEGDDAAAAGGNT